MNAGRAASALGKGLVAGFVGTAAMTASSSIEARLRGRKPSSAPARAASKVLGISPVGEDEKNRFSTLVHWAYGTAWGVPRGLLAEAGLPWPAATGAHMGALWGTEAVMLPALKVSPPVTEWSKEEIAIDVWHHVVYSVAAGLTYLFLERSERKAVPDISVREFLKQKARRRFAPAFERAHDARERLEPTAHAARERVEPVLHGAVERVEPAARAAGERLRPAVARARISFKVAGGAARALRARAA